MILVEVQHFTGCPNSTEMIRRVKEAMQQIPFDLHYKEILVETRELARQVNFRGSPTVLVNGIDLEYLPEPPEGNLACRYYKSGLPVIEEIKYFIIQQAGKGITE